MNKIKKCDLKIIKINGDFSVEQKIYFKYV